MEPPATANPPPNAAAILGRFAQRRVQGESCEFCSEGLGGEHRHVLEVTTRRIVCACTACALRFENVVGKWKLIPRNPRRLVEFRMSEAQWEALALPIELAFFFRSTSENRVVALYPSPAGAIESLLPLANWEFLSAQNPILGEMNTDVEALLSNRLREAREYYIAPIDVCFELVGLIRLHWRGLSGGEKVWQELQTFFANISAVATEIPAGPCHA